ncbi:hypothetical protein C2E23DRAFT_699536, partial [Lenzites betulinus]
MRIDGSTRAQTEIDEDTGGILLRRLHPRIANYNDLVIFLMKSNIEIKFIGSGEAAKALLYYITDYITKSSLPAHIGLAALSYAIQKTNEKFPHMTEGGEHFRPKSALNMVVNRMMAHQEISHQQVMSYVVGGGDVYTSHKYRVLHWGSFDRMFKQADNEEVGGQDDSGGETCVLSMQEGTISAMSQQQDYLYRSTDSPFDGLSLYEFVARTTKDNIGRDAARRRAPREGEDMHRQEDTGTEQERRRLRAGQKPLPRGRFSSSEHTQYETHILRMRQDCDVPVILGDHIPRSDRGDEEKEAWARMMLILFVPWRRPTDWRRPDESWLEALTSRRHKISAAHEKVIANMNVLSECRDVRDGLREMRRAEAMAVMRDFGGGIAGDMATHTGLGAENISDDYQLFGHANESCDVYEDAENLRASEDVLNTKIGARAREVLDTCYAHPDDMVVDDRQHARTARVRTEDDDRALSQHMALMRELKRARRPVFASELHQETARARKRRRVAEVVESFSSAVLGDTASTHASAHGEGSSNERHDIEYLIEKVVEEMQLASNAEQEQAFRTIAAHVGQSGADQLLMYIAGVGGTGKTHVIKAVLKLFEYLGR